MTTDITTALAQHTDCRVSTTETGWVYTCGVTVSMADAKTNAFETIHLTAVIETLIAAKCAEAATAAQDEAATLLEGQSGGAWGVLTADPLDQHGTRIRAADAAARLVRNKPPAATRSGGDPDDGSGL